MQILRPNIAVVDRESMNCRTVVADLASLHTLLEIGDANESTSRRGKPTVGKYRVKKNTRFPTHPLEGVHIKPTYSDGRVRA